MTVRSGREQGIIRGKLGIALLLLAGVAGPYTVYRALFCAPELPQANPARIVFSGVTVVNPGRTTSSGQTVVVESGLIRSIAPDAADAAQSEYPGHYLLPGLIDLHVHLMPAWALSQDDRFAALFLAHGVTTVRDMSLSSAHATRASSDTGSRVGPRVFGCGGADGASSLPRDIVESAAQDSPLEVGYSAYCHCGAALSNTEWSTELDQARIQPAEF